MARLKNPKYLETRARRWYVTMDVPKDVRHLFDDKPRLVQSLRTESVTEAERRRDPIISTWRDQIARARTSLKDDTVKFQYTAEQWREDLAGVGEEERDVLEDVLPLHMDRLNLKGASERERFESIVIGKTRRTDEHLDEWLRSLDLTQKSVDQKASDVRRMAKKFPYTNDITKKAVKAWVTDLQKGEGYASATVRRFISSSKGYWDYLEDIEAVDGGANPFERVSPSKSSRTKPKPDTLRQPFSPEELVKLLRRAVNESSNESRGLASIIWFGMLTGCRIEELAQVRVEDVFEDRFKVSESKTNAGIREVPLHPWLKESVAAWAEQSDDGYLLPSTSSNKHDKRSDALGKRFGRLKTKEGFGRIYVFHSIRKTVSTQAEQLGVPENVSSDILGHEKKTMTYGLYSGGTLFADRIAAISRVSYPVSQSEIDRLSSGIV